MASKKRQRIILLCDTCHKRKIRCDRKLPCDTCKSKGVGALCRYSNLEEELSKQGKSTEKIKAGDGADSEANEIAQLKHKINQLQASIGLASMDPLRNVYDGSNDGNGSVSGSLNGNRKGSGPRLSIPNYGPQPITGMSSTSPLDGDGVPTPMATLGSDNPSPFVYESDVSGTHNFTEFFSNKFSPNSCYRLNDSYIASCPLLFLSIIRKDVGYVLFWHFNRLKAQQETLTKQSVEGLEGLGHLLDTCCSKDRNIAERSKEYFGNLFIPPLEKNTSLLDYPAKDIVNKFYSGDEAQLFNPNPFPPNSNTYSKIIHLLPPKSIILQYLEVFFDHMDPYFPIFEKQSFIEDISKLISDNGTIDTANSSEYQKVQLNFEKKVDIAKISSLLLVLRFVHLYVAVAWKTKPELKNLLDYPIYIEVVHAAREGLKEFDLATNKLFAVLQAFAMAKVYKATSQDEGEGLKETDIYVSSLISCAYVIGLNRDPDIYAHDDLTWINRTHRRKFWFFLMWLKSIELFHYGRNSGQEIQTDVKLDQLNNTNDNVLYLCMSKLLPIKRAINDLVKSLLDMHEPVSMKYFTAMVAKIEALISQNYPSINELVNIHITGIASPFHTQELTVLISLKMFVVKMYLALYIIYETGGDANNLFYYFKKMCECIFLELQPLYGIIHDYGDSLDPMFYLCFCQQTTKLLIPFIILTVTLVLRLNYSIKLYTGTQEKPEHFIGLLKDIRFLGCHTLRYSGNLSKKYYMSWKASRAILYGLRETNNYRTFEEFCDGRSSAWIFSTDQIHELCNIISTAADNATAAANANIEYPSPIKSSMEFLWLDLVPYDSTKLTEENLDIQRFHVYQMDNFWQMYLTSLQDSVPDSFKNNESNFATDMPGFLDNDIFNGGLDLNLGLGSLFSVDSFLSNE